MLIVDCRWDGEYDRALLTEGARVLDPARRRRFGSV
jgi:hypothetical protein